MDENLPTPDQFADAAADLAKLLREAKGAVIGGFALSLLVEGRSTRDIDAVIGETPDHAAFLTVAEKHGFTPRVPDPVAFAKANLVWLLMHRSGVPVDLVIALTTFEQEAIKSSTDFEVGNGLLPVVNPPFLLAMKAFAGRSIDRADVQRLLETYPDIDLRPAIQLLESTADIGQGMTVAELKALAKG